jgi:hypothetical protein
MCLYWDFYSLRLAAINVLINRAQHTRPLDMYPNQFILQNPITILVATNPNILAVIRAFAPKVGGLESHCRPAKDCAVWYDLVRKTPGTACTLHNGYDEMTR